MPTPSLPTWLIRNLLTLALFTTVALSGQTRCPSLGDDALTRPTANGEPTKVALSVYISDIAEVNDVQQTFTADVYILAAWADPRIAEPGKPTDRVSCDGMGNVAWQPTLAVANGRDLSVTSEETGISRAGEIFLLQRLYGEFSNLLDLRDFPLDSHELKISVMAIHNLDDVVLVAGDRLAGMAEFLTVPGWAMTPGQAEVVASTPPGTAENVYYMHYRFDAQRDAAFYGWKLFLPLTLIVFMSWSVFYFDPAALPPQISVSVTSMLTLIAYQFALGQLLPRVSYLTLADRFTLGSSILIFVALVEVVTVNSLTRHDRLALALSIQRTARWIFPAAYLIICGFVFLV
jgi:neurotransmitter-gated ion-channel